MQTTNATFLTSGDIAEALGRSVFQVRYVLDSRPDLQPLARAGLIRLYPAEVVERVRVELADIAANRAKRRCARMPATRAMD